MRASNLGKMLCLMGLLWGQLTLAQSNYSFRSVGTEQGLSDNYIEHVYEDNKGFLWVATHAGLNRFDGSSVKIYNFPPKKTSVGKINHNFITYLQEDAEHNLWIATFGGIYKKMAESDSFVHYEYNAKGRSTLSNNQVECIVNHPKAGLWLATQDGLNKYDATHDKFRTYRSAKGSMYYTLCFDPSGKLWVGSYGSGLFSYNAKADSVEQYKSFKPRFVRCVFADNTGTIWVGTTDAGVWRKKNTETLFTRVLLTTANGQLLNPEITAINKDLNGHIWFGTSDCGVLVYDLLSESITVYNEQMDRPFALTANSVDNIFRDSKGTMWVATHGGGVNYYSPYFSVLQFQKSKSKNWLQGNIVSCFLEDSEKRMWIGTDGNGFCRFDLKQKRFINYTTQNGLASNAVLDIVQITPQLLAIASWNGGLSLFNTQTEKFQNFLYNPAFADNKGNNIRSLAYDKDNGLLWCATYNNSVRAFDLKKLKFVEQRADLKKINAANGIYDFTVKILLDNKKRVWTATWEEVFRLDSSVVIFPHSHNQSDLIDESVADLCIDSKDQLWVATASGLNKYNEKSNSFSQIKLPITKMRAMLEDGKGNFWLTTADGLFHYNKAQNKLENMSDHWGIPRVEYNYKAAYRTPRGYLYFGGINGFIVFHEDSIYSQTDNPPAFVTRLLIHNAEQLPGQKQSPLVRDIVHTTKLVLDPSQSFITLEYASLNFIDNKKNRYQYQLKGFDKQWIDAGTEHRAVYTNIPPGEYQFEVRCTNSNGTFTGNKTCLSIRMLPPWWSTWWFKSLLSLLLVAIIVTLFYIRERTVRNRNRRLEHKVEQRTAELAAANHLLSEQKEELLSQYTQVEEQQKVIQIKNEELTETIQTKDRIISVLAHDLKNPLTTLVGFSELLQQGFETNTKEKLRSYVVHVTTSAQSILSQINSLLEWAGSRTKDIKYTPENANLDTLLRDAITLQHEMALKKQIELQYECVSRRAAWGDSRMISTIMRNIIANSIKFTHLDGKIYIRIYDQEQYVCFSVSDTGIGIKDVDTFFADQKPKTQLGTDMEKGFGMGMIICKDFVEKNNGILEVRSELDRGSCFTVKLPAGQILFETTESTSIEVPKIEITDNQDSDEDLELLLIIEDNQELSAYLKNIFAGQFTIEIAHDGVEGLQKAFDLLPDLVFCDINMPRMNGRELCQRLKTNSISCHIPFFFITSEALPEQQVEGILLGADDYIIKPFNVEILKSKVMALRRNRETLRKHLRREMLSEPSQQNPSSNEERFVIAVTKIIEEQIASEDLTVESLAQQLMLSRAQIFRKFKTIVGQSPNDFIKTYRLRKAAQMFKTGLYRVSEVAYNTGFADPRYFSTCFTKEFGINPTKFIENAMAEAENNTNNDK